MFRFLFTVLFATALFSFCGCDEVGPNINLHGNGGDDTSGGNVDTNQKKMVLIEDFTATNCPNCPKARDIIDNLLSQYGDRMEVVEVHQGILSVPLEQGDPQLKTADGEALASYLGPPAYWPIGAINRVNWEVSPGTFSVLVDRSLWSTYVMQQLDSPLAVKLGLDFSFDDMSRKLSGSVTVNFLKTVSAPLNITVLITESGIEAAQLNGADVISGYIHHDVLRDIITNFSGDPVTGSKAAGSNWQYSISPYDIPQEWNADSCRIIAFVSQSAGSYEVLQALGTPLKN